MMNGPDDMERITKWILAKGWYEQFRLAAEIEITLDEKMRRFGQGRTEFTLYRQRKRTCWKTQKTTRHETDSFGGFFTELWFPFV